MAALSVLRRILEYGPSLAICMTSQLAFVLERERRRNAISALWGIAADGGLLRRYKHNLFLGAFYVVHKKAP